MLRVGKSSLLGRYTKGEFTHRYVATIGADFTTKDVHIDKKRITLQIWDTAGSLIILIAKRLFNFRRLRFTNSLSSRDS